MTSNELTGRRTERRTHHPTERHINQPIARNCYDKYNAHEKKSHDEMEEKIVEGEKTKSKEKMKEEEKRKRK